jgi:carboxylate-amine ligase
VVGSPLKGGPLSKLEFSKNKNMGLGVEIEIQLIDPITGDLKPVGPQILHTLKDNPEASHIKTEIFQSMIELDTPICQNATEVGTSLRKSLALAREVAFKHDAQIIMAGTHPFAHYSERLLTPAGRYFTLVDRNKWITRRLQIFGMHVHIGMKDGEHAIAMNNALCHYLPLLLAISASSPYWHRDDTGLASSRITFFEAIPTGGHPYLLNTWSEFESLVEKLTFSKSITSLKDLWWDIRPNVEYGTIEIRIADCPPTIKEVEALVALIHSLAIYIDAELTAGRKFSPPPEWVLRENKWRASRHGVQCDLIIDSKGTSVPFVEAWQGLRKSIGAILETQGYSPFIDFIETVIANGPSYFRQRMHYQNGFDAIIRHLVRENENDQPEWRAV